MITLDGHPRAKAGIRRTKAATGLGMALVAGFLAHRAGVPGQEVVLRALLAGVVGHLIGWAAAIVWFRMVARAEIMTALDARQARVDAAKARLEAEIVQSG